jgi:hypothetical protein
MNHHKNKYAKQAQRTELMGFTEKLKNHDYKKTLADTGKDIIIGGIGGGLAGTLIGRYSFLLGIVVAGVGHAFNSPATSGFGVGLMASGGFQGVNPVNGTDDVVDGVKDRLAHYKENIKKQFFIDKLQKLKADKKDAGAEEGTNGMGNVQYIKHPNPEDTDLNGKTELDFSEANKLEQQIEESAKQFAQKQGMSGDFSGTETDDMSGVDDDISDRLV